MSNPKIYFADLSFAMYKVDLQTTEPVKAVQDSYGYPAVVSASTGKNEPDRTLVDYGNKVDNSKPHSEIILGLPGDSREKHITSLKLGRAGSSLYLKCLSLSPLSV